MNVIVGFGVIVINCLLWRKLVKKFQFIRVLQRYYCFKLDVYSNSVIPIGATIPLMGYDKMKHLLITTIAAVVLVGCGESQ